MKKKGIGLGILYAVLSLQAHAGSAYISKVISMSSDADRTPIAEDANGRVGVDGAAQGVAIGATSVAKLGSSVMGDSATSNSQYGISIGTQSRVDENAGGSIALGYNSSVKKDAQSSLAIGANSIATESNEVSVGNDTLKRKITNVESGKADNDAVNVKQLKDVESSTLKSANTYTDHIADGTLKSANTYTDHIADGTLKSANTYTDHIVDGTLKSANTYTDHIADGTLKSANDYADNSSSQTLSYANAYTDKKISELNNNHQQIKNLSKKIDRVNKKLNAGIAGVTAIASIPYLNNSNFSYGMGGGTYSNGQAMAAGMQVRMTENTAARINMSWDSSRNSSVGVGFAGGW